MMRKLLATTAIIVSVIAMGGTAKANPFTIETTNTLEVIKQPDKAKKQKQVKKHVVSRGDNLTKIAKMYNSSVQRLFNKNKNISNPDVLKVGQVIVIPAKGEKLKHRPMSQVYSESPSKRLRVAQNGKLLGSIGSVSPYGNCVNEPGVNNPGWGNPIDWPVLSSTPKIGATALWTYNHTGVVTGIYEGGQYIEVRHQNYGGGQTKFHISDFRGFR